MKNKKQPEYKYYFFELAYNEGQNAYFNVCRMLKSIPFDVAMNSLVQELMKRCEKEGWKPYHLFAICLYGKHGFDLYENDQGDNYEKLFATMWPTADPDKGSFHVKFADGNKLGSGFGRLTSSN